jgi:hypothetical protein
MLCICTRAGGELLLRLLRQVIYYTTAKQCIDDGSGEGLDDCQLETL